MKPIVIYQEIKDEKIILSKEEFEKYLEDAYQAGYSDGSNSFTAKGYTWSSTNLPNISQSPSTNNPYKDTPYWSSTSPVYSGNVVKTVPSNLD